VPMEFNINEVFFRACHSRSHRVSSMATDGAYLYVHCAQGLYKVGTGLQGTTPGYVLCALFCFSSRVDA
jgi:hypothetical protein